MSTTTTDIGVVGTPLDRVDGRLKVMGAATRQLAGKADGKTISALVRQLLS